MLSPTRTVIESQAVPLAAHLRPLEPWRALWRHRHVIAQLGRRQVQARHRGTYLGMLWNLVNPLLLLSVYSLVFIELMPVGVEPGERLAFVLRMFCGLVLFNCFAETVLRAPGTVLGSANYVKKIVFPLEALPAADLWASAVGCGMNLVVLLAAAVFAGSGLHASMLLFPLVLPPLLLFTLGVAWLVAALGVYVRDLQASIGVLMTVLFFLTPVFYSLEGQDDSLRAVLQLNPLAVLIEASRATLLAGQAPSWRSLGLAYVVALIVAQAGFAWFRATKRGFVDVV